MSELAALIDELYDFPTCATGGPLHVVVDDANVEDEFLDFCEREGADPADRARIREVSLAIIAGLRPLFLDERRRVCG